MSVDIKAAAQQCFERIEKEFAANDWTLASDDDGVDLYTKTVSESPIQAIKVTGIVNIEPHKLIDKLYTMPLEDWKKLDDALLTREVVENVDENHQLVYQTSHLPWPLWPRDLSMGVARRSRPDGGAVLLLFSVKSDKMPEKPKEFVRAEMAFSAFLALPHGDNKTKFYRIVVLNPAGSLPTALVNSKIHGARAIVPLINQHLA
eukprot:TRINITY_DN2254_c0_g1_i1.p1 TRINITY_DN2254_c0_g1~~TRINITY_DN2254_c0_g1_i1.p1  ORF type:complete len:235 (-),score=57.31 TRINITY_DN2254_c0_g1_i1:53-664(-)